MRSLALLLPITLALAACGDERPITGAKPEPREEIPRVMIAGLVEKGPFVEGTVAIAPVDGGAAVTTAIQDGLGRYAAWVPAAPVYRLEAAGLAYRETAGAVGPARLTLRALHPGSSETAHVNALTHLAHDRAVRLAADGAAWPDAIARADDEVHVALGIGVPFFAPSRPASALSMLGADDVEHAYALAVAALLDRAAGDGPGPFLDALAADLADDGALAAETADRLLSARRELDAERITAALRAWLDRTGHADVVVPDLRRILDSDRDGIPDREETLVVDPARLSIARHGLGRSDEAAGAGGAITGGCPPWAVEVFDRAEGGAALAAGAAAADGSFALPFGTPTSSRPTLWVEAADACGSRTARVEIVAGADRSPPAIVADAFAIVRHGLEAPDGVRADPGAVSDGEGPVAAVWIASTLEGGRLVHAVPAPDGGFEERAVGTADASFPRLWVEAVDKAGNVSARVEVEEGASFEPPTIDPSRVAVIRRGIGAFDGLLGHPGAVVGTCHPVELRIADQAEGFWVAEAPVEGDGGFEEVLVGDTTRTPPRLWLHARDKCGQVGVPAELEAARDVDPPAIDPTRVVFVAGASRNEAAGLPGAVSDPTGVAEVRLHETDCVVQVRTAETVRADGSFESGDLTGFTSSEASICVAATDKAGNVSAKVKSRRVRAELDAQSEAFGGRPEIALFAGPMETDPRALAAGYGAWAASRLADQARARLVQGGGCVVEAAAETRDVPFAWRWLDLNLPAPDVVAAGAVAPLTGPPTVLRTMGDWPWLITLERRCQYSCSSWTWDVVDVHGPPRRSGMAMAFGSNGLYAFGGTDGSLRYSDTWVRDGLGPWTQLSGAGGPAATAVRMVRDPVGLAPLLVAAVEGDPTLQVWQFQVATSSWTRIPAAGGPSYREGFAVALDQVRGNVVLFGGKTAAGVALGDTWLWNGTSWSSPALVTNPPARWGHGMATSPLDSVVVLRGGSGAGALDGWTWDGTRWTHRDSDGRDNGVGVAVVADTGTSRLFTFHSSTPTGATSPLFTVRYEDLAGVGADEFLGPNQGGLLSWNPWLQAATMQAGLQLPPPWNLGVGWLWQDGRWLLSAGEDFVASGRSQVVDTHRGLRLDLGNGGSGRAVDERGNAVTFGLPSWPSGVVPSFVYDARHARTIGTGGGQSWALGAVDLSRGAIGSVPVAGGPAGSARVELVFDPVRGRTIAFDGTGTWELEGDAWVFTVAAPPSCPGGRLLFDPAIGKVLKLAGTGPAETACALECVYDGAWSCGATQGPGPDLAGAPDLTSTQLVAHGAGSRTWIREGATPHRRTPAFSVSAGLPSGAMALGAAIEVEAQATGRNGSTVTALPYELLAWNWLLEEWTSLGVRSPGGSAGPHRFELPADPTPFVGSGRLWLQVAPRNASIASQPPAATWTPPESSSLTISTLGLEVEYLRP